MTRNCLCFRGREYACAINASIGLENIFLAVDTHQVYTLLRMWFRNQSRENTASPNRIVAYSFQIAQLGSIR